jgi:hypothetical protein
VFVRWWGAAGVGPAILLAMLVWWVFLLSRFARWTERPVSELLVAPFQKPLVCFVPVLALGMLLVRDVQRGRRAESLLGGRSAA